MRYQKRFFNLLKVSSPGNMDHLVLNELHSYSVISQSSSNFTINFSLCFIDVFICWSVYRRMVCTSKVCSWRVPDGTELTRCHFWYQCLLVWFVFITLFLISRVIFPTDFVILRIAVYGTTASCFILFIFQPIWNTWIFKWYPFFLL